MSDEIILEGYYKWIIRTGFVDTAELRLAYIAGWKSCALNWVETTEFVDVHPATV